MASAFPHPPGVQQWDVQADHGGPRTRSEYLLGIVATQRHLDQYLAGILSVLSCADRQFNIEHVHYKRVYIYAYASVSLALPYVYGSNAHAHFIVYRLGTTSSPFSRQKTSHDEQQIRKLKCVGHSNNIVVILSQHYGIIDLLVTQSLALLYTENLNLTPFSSSSPLGTKGSLGSLHAGEKWKILFSDSLVLRPHPLQQKGLVIDVFASLGDLFSCKQANQIIAGFESSIIVYSNIINFGRCT